MATVVVIVVVAEAEVKAVVAVAVLAVVVVVEVEEVIATSRRRLAKVGRGNARYGKKSYCSVPKSRVPALPPESRPYRSTTKNCEFPAMYTYAADDARTLAWTTRERLLEAMFPRKKQAAVSQRALHVGSLPAICTPHKMQDLPRVSMFLFISLQPQNLSSGPWAVRPAPEAHTAPPARQSLGQ